MSTLSSDRRPAAEASPASAAHAGQPWLEILREAVASLDFGTIQIKVHNREVVQIETTRKIRVGGS